MDDGRRYWAFLSYSHKDRDWARWLHRALESYAIPKRLVGRQSPAGAVPKRMRPVFKDREDLAANPDLRERVHAALADSTALIVICSPAAARSPWVEDEIVRFKSLHGEARVFAVIVAGTPDASRVRGGEAEECFPPALRFHVDRAGALSEDRADLTAADLRANGDGRRLGKLKLVAGLLGLDLDDLVRRDAHRRGQQLTALTAASLAGAVVMGGLALAALASRNEARAQRAQAEGLVGFMLNDLRKNLEPTGRLDLLDAVAARAMTYYSHQASHGLDAIALGQRAQTLHLLGELSERRGDLTSASRSFEKAQAATADLLARAPNDTGRIYNQAQSVYYVGEVAKDRGQDRLARARFLEYRRLADRLVALQPGREDWLVEVGYANTNLGALDLRSGRADEAVNAFSKALTVGIALAQKAPGDRDRQSDLAQYHAWLGDAELARGHREEAMRQRLAERAIYKIMLARQPSDNDAADSQIVNETAVGKILIEEGNPAAALQELRPAVEDSKRLGAIAPDDTSLRQHRALALETEARAELATGALKPAAADAAQALSLAETLVLKSSGEVEWQGALLGTARALKMRIAARQARSPAAAKAALAAAPAEAVRLSRLLADHPTNPGVLRAEQEVRVLAARFESLR